MVGSVHTLKLLANLFNFGGGEGGWGGVGWRRGEAGGGGGAVRLVVLWVCGWVGGAKRLRVVKD